MRKKSASIILIACLLTAALLSSVPLLGNLWVGVTIAASVCGDLNASIGATVVGAYSTLGIWGGIAAGVLTPGIGWAITAGMGL